MKLKYIVILIMLFCFCKTTFAEKRAKPLPMKELTNPSSPSYVPHPYPNNKEEIVEDLKYAIKKLFNENNDVQINSKTPTVKKLLLKLLEKDSVYEVAETVKVKNRAHRMGHDYTWLILIRDQMGEIVVRVCMRANGLFGGAVPTAGIESRFKALNPNSKRGPHRLITNQDALDCLSEAIGKNVYKKEVKTMERVAFQSAIGALYFPMWETKMKSGKTYYYSSKRDAVYEIEKKVSWKKENKEGRKDIRSLISNYPDYVPDTINDEILVLKKLTRNHNLQ